MSETVNTGSILTSDGKGGYSKFFTDTMTDLVKLSDGSTLTKKLEEIDGKLPITLTSGSLPNTLGFGKVAFACNSSGDMTILAGKNDKSVVKIISSEDHPICYEEVNGETVDPFKIDADTLEGKSVQDIVNLVPNPDLSNVDAKTLNGKTADEIRNIKYGTADIGVGAALASGCLYFVYE